jgi:CheY-like chemotaxis protein
MLLEHRSRPDEDTYQRVIHHALEQIQQLEQDIITLNEHWSIAKIHRLVRLTHALKRGAVQVQFTAIQVVARQFEHILRAFYQPEIATHVSCDDLLPQAYGYLRQMWVTKIQGRQDDVVAFRQAEKVLAQLTMQIQAVGYPITPLRWEAVTEPLFLLDIADHLEQFTDALLEPMPQTLTSTLNTYASTLIQWGELLDLPQLIVIACSAQTAQQNHPDHQVSIGRLLMKETQLICEAFFQSRSIPQTVPSLDWMHWMSIPLNESRVEHNLVHREATDLVPSAAAIAPALTHDSTVANSPFNRRLTAAWQLPARPLSTPASKFSSERLDSIECFVCQADQGVLITLPCEHILQFLIPTAAQVISVQDQQFLHWQEQMLPIYKLSELLAYEHSSASKSALQDNAVTSLSMLVIQQVHERVALALQINRVLSDVELMIHRVSSTRSSPDPYYSITLDGQELPVVDIIGLLNDGLQASGQTPPRLMAPMQPLALQSKPPAASELSPASRRFVPTILIVDDSRMARQILEFTLQDVGYQIMQAEDGEQAIAQLQQHPTIQFVICDVEMQRMDGFAFLQYCRQTPQFATLSIMMLSSRGAMADQQRAKQLGACAYLTKPYDEGELLTTVQTLLPKIIE